MMTIIVTHVSMCARCVWPRSCLARQGRSLSGFVRTSDVQPLEYAPMWHQRLLFSHQQSTAACRVCLLLAPLNMYSIWSVEQTFQWRFKVQNSQIFIPHVQHSLVAGRLQTSQVTTSWVFGSQCSPSSSNSSRSTSSPPVVCTHVLNQG